MFKHGLNMLKEGFRQALACVAHQSKQILCKDRILFWGGDFLWRGAPGERRGGVFFCFRLLLLLFFSSFCLFSLSPLFSLMSACIVWFGLYGLYCLISLNGRTKKIFQLFYKSCKTEAKIVFWTLVWTRTLFTDICSWTPFTTYIWTWAWTAFDRSGASSMFMKTVHEHIPNEHEHEHHSPTWRTQPHTDSHRRCTGEFSNYAELCKHWKVRHHSLYLRR